MSMTVLAFMQAGLHERKAPLWWYVGGLPKDATPQSVLRAFNRRFSGGVRTVSIPVSPDGARRGYGFIKLSDPKVALQLMDEVDSRGGVYYITVDDRTAWITRRARDRV